MLPCWALQGFKSPPLNADDASMFSVSEHITSHSGTCQKVQDWSSRTEGSHPGSFVKDVDTNMHKRLLACMEAGDIEVIDLWEEGDGNQPVQPYKLLGLKVLRELLADKRLAGLQHFAFKEYKNARGERILACDANGSLTFQLAQLDVGPGKVPISIVLDIDGTFIKRGIPIRPIYCKFYNILYNMLFIVVYNMQYNTSCTMLCTM